MQVSSVWRERLETPLRDVLAVADRTTPAAATASNVFLQALESALVESIAQAGQPADEAPQAATAEMDDARWESTLKHAVDLLGRPLFDTTDTPDAPSDECTPRQLLQSQARARGEQAEKAREAAQQIEAGFVWLSIRLHHTVTASANDFLALCAPEKAQNEEDNGRASTTLLDDDNPLAAPAPSVPEGVQLAVITIANAILSLQKSRAQDKISDQSANAAAPLPGLRQPTLEIWFSFVMSFLQQMSANGADAKSLWSTFLEDSREAVAKHTAAARRALSSKAPAGSTTEGLTSASIAALSLWTTTVTPALLAETVLRTRFRRAAQLFRANAPHLLTQAPHTAFLVSHLLKQFAEQWSQTLEQEIPLGALSVPAQTLFSAPLFDTKSAMPTPPAATLPHPAERALYELVASTASGLSHLLGESGMHMSLTASIIGATLCATCVMPATRRGSGANNTPQGAAGSSTASAGHTTAATATTPTPGSAAVPMHVVGRRATTSRSALTNSAFEDMLSSHSGAGVAPAVETTSVADSKLRRHTALPLENLDALEAQAWLLPRPVGRRQCDAASVPARAGHDDYLCTEAEWRVRQFAPLGLVLRQAGLYAFLPPHLFHWSTQLRLGVAAAHHREGRQRFALAALLSGVCSMQVAVTLFHAASQPPATAAAGAAPLPPVYAALGGFTAAMESFVCKAEMERVVEVGAGGTGAALGLGVLAETRKRQRRGAKRQQSANDDGDAASDEQEAVTFRNGELAGERFVRMVYPEPMPQWTHFLSQKAPYATVSSHAASSTGTAPANGGGEKTAVSGAHGRSATVLAAECVSPLRFVMELLTARFFSLSAATIEYWSCQPEPVNVFLVPRAALSMKEAGSAVNAQLFIALTTQRWLQQWKSSRADDHDAESLKTQERVLREELLPLWRLANTFCARADVLSTLLSHLVDMATAATELLNADSDVCAATAAGNATREHGAEESDVCRQVPRPRASVVVLARRVLATTELYVMQVVFPCLRVMPPSPVVYDALQCLLTTYEACDWRVRYGADLVRPLHIDAWFDYLLAPLPNTPARIREDASSSTARHCRRYPHDILLSKERQALFVQSLKRANARTVDYYRRLLRPVMFADPLFVIDRVLSQAVGYENNFLAQHTRLLHALPPPILLLLMHRGLALMHLYVTKEKLESSPGEGGAAVSTTRVGLIASFLCSVWSDNTSRIDGALLLRAAELALRGQTRFDTVLGLELLKAVFFQLLHRTLEHEEQYNDVQCMALATASTTRLFARGQMESFRVGRWSGWMTPLRLQAGHTALQAALMAPLDVPIAEEDEDEDEQEGDNAPQAPPTPRKVLRLSVGQHMLLHLARRQARIYALQADLDGTMEAILATSSRDYNTITDLLFAVEELLPEGPPERLLHRVALPHVAMRLSARFRLKRCRVLRSHSPERPEQLASSPPAYALSTLEASILEVPPLHASSTAVAESAAVAAYLAGQDAAWVAEADSSNAATASPDASKVGRCPAPLSYTLLRALSYFSVAHLRFDEAPYAAALREMEACRLRIGGGGGSSGAAGDMDDWLDEKQSLYQLEKAAHERLYVQSESARTALRERLESEVFVSLDATYVLGVSHLLPRALLSLEETTFVVEFFRWLLAIYVPDVTASGAGAVDGQLSRNYAERVVDMIYSIITQAATLFVGLTDGEAKRLGYLLSRLIKVLQEVEVRQCAGTPPPGLCHTLSPIAAALVAESEKRAAAAAASRSADDTVAGHESAAGGNGGEPSISAAVGGGGGGRAALALSAEALSAAFGFPEQPVKGNSTEAPPAHLLLEALNESTESGVATNEEGEGSGVRPEEESGAAGADHSGPASASPASLLQLEAFLLRFFTTVLRDQVNVPPHLHRHVFLILERVDKRAFPSTRLGADLLLRAVKPHSHESNVNFASATAVLKGLRDALRQKNAILNVVSRYTEKSVLSETVPADVSGGGAGDVRVSAPIDVVVAGHTRSVSPAEATAAMQAWGRQWRLRETYLGQLLASELQAAGMTGSAQDGADEEEDEEEASEANDGAEADAHDDSAPPPPDSDSDGDGPEAGPEEDDEQPDAEQVSSDSDAESLSDDEEGEPENEGSLSADSNAPGSSHDDDSSGDDDDGSGGGDERTTRRRRLE